jgi:hypothetical protein
VSQISKLRERPLNRLRVLKNEFDFDRPKNGTRVVKAMIYFRGDAATAVSIFNSILSAWVNQVMTCAYFLLFHPINKLV